MMKAWLALLLTCVAAFGQNRALDLKGAGDFVELPRDSLTSLTNATIEAWVQFRSFNGAGKRVFNYGAPWRDVSLGERDNGELWFVFPQSRSTIHQVSTRNIIHTGEWVHLAATLGSQGMKLYVNGFLIDQNSSTRSFDKTSADSLFRLGETITTSDPPSEFDGMIDEVRLWKTERTRQEIRADMHRHLTGAEPNLFSLWNFDDGTARDAGPAGLHGEFKGKAAATAAKIPAGIGVSQIYLDARVFNFKGQGDEAILEIKSGTNLVTARYANDGVFKLFLAAPVTPLTLHAVHLYGSAVLTNVSVPAGEQTKLRIDLPAFVASPENTNRFAAALNNVLTVDPATLEKLDPSMMLKLAPLLHESEDKILSLFQSPDVGRRRFISMFLEKFGHSTLPMVIALAKARHDRDEIVRGLAQRSLQSLPVPAELEAVYSKRESTTAALFAGLLIPFALIHFFLFVLNPTKTSNLYYGLFAAAGALTIYYGAGDSDSAGAQIAGLAFMMLGLMALYSLFYPRFPWTFWAVLLVVATASTALFIERNEIAHFSSIELGSSSLGFNFPLAMLAAIGGGYLALAVVVLDTLRVVLRSVWRGQQGAWLVGAGFLILIVAGIVRFSLYFGLFSGQVSPDTFAKYIIYFPGSGAAGFVICGSIYLAKSFSRTFSEVQTTKIEIEKKNAELTLARDAALTANQTKSQFLANMSHELRTPLNAIIGYSELVAELAADEGHKQYLPDLEKVTTAAKHQLMLVNDILDLSKIEAGKTTVNVAEFDVKAMIHEIRNMIAPLVSKKRNRLEIDCPGGIGKMRSDETKVRQVLFNLLTNAAKFTEEGLITLRIAETKLNGAPAIQFEVTDTGIGMTGEQVGRLFQPFTQAHTEIHQKYGGTGLGLVISRRFCEMLNGALTVRSHLGKGSTFTATLPLQMPELSP